MPSNSSECDSTTTTTFSTSSNPNQLVAWTKVHDDVDENHETNKILFSDVSVKRKNRTYWWRKWKMWNFTIFVGLMHQQKAVMARLWGLCAKANTLTLLYSPHLSRMENRDGWKNVGDLEKQFFYRFLRKTNVIHPLLVGIPLFRWGGFPMVVYGLVNGLDRLGRRLA
ncbi:hypothetical protein Sjap_005318 [Stephania japonica]|uniref:Uncharacterized protein n=1 Tax=Stephania japonica TaxID=461633 RepID=A0AAP0K4X1_9MAGN